MSALSQTLSALDSIPARVESIHDKVATTATKARVALETMAVAMEDGEGEKEFIEPKELMELKELDTNEIARLKAELAHLKTDIIRYKKSDDFLRKLIKIKILPPYIIQFIYQIICDVHILEIMLSFVDPSEGDNDSIISVSERGHVEVVDRLLQDPRVDPTANNNKAIRVAHQNGHVAVVELLRAHGCVLPQQPQL